MYNKLSDLHILWKLEGLCLIFFVYITVLTLQKLEKLRHHPLRSYAGPKLAALTIWYKVYHEVIRDGRLLDLLERLHERYGPVVRIAPNELHFSDPTAFADIYASGSKFVKEPTLYASFGEDEASVAFIDPRRAKARRDVLSPLFSRRAILKLEGIIQEKVDKLVARLQAATSHDTTRGKPINMSRAFRSMTLDIITAYCFATCHEVLEAPDFSHPFLVAMESTSSMLWIFKYFPFIRSALLCIPQWLSFHLSPPSKAFVEVRRKMAAQVDYILEDPGSLEHADHEIIYHHLLTPQRNHPVPSVKSLEQEATNLIFAGSDTVGNTCALGTFYIVNDKPVCEKLVAELDTAWLDKDSVIGYEVLERLPYLTAVIKESLRMAHGVVIPLPRVVTPTDAMIAGKRVPAGTVVSIGSTFLHWNPDIFANPRTFSPERWLQPNARQLENYLVPFSRGPRSCLGINLAWCELYLIFANVFRKIDLRLCGTTEDDFKFKAYFLPDYEGRFLYAHVRERSM